MDKTKQFLEKNRESLDIYAGFSDYDVLIDAIENKRTTDNCIEACKALIEGISKTILMKVNIRSQEVEAYLDDKQKENMGMAIKKIQSNTIDFPFVYKQAAIALSAYHQGFEKDFVFEAGHSFCNFIGKIRNRQGDVSHGRVAPKYDKSTMDLASMVERITDVLALHMLEIFSLIDFSKDTKYESDKLIEESFLYKTLEQLREIGEDEMMIRKFNSYLDETKPLDGKLRYSMALYQQSYEDYQMQFSEFIDMQDLENL